MKHDKSLTFLLIPSFSLVLFCTGVGSPANAAGPDSPELSHASESVDFARCILDMDGQATDVVPPTIQQRCKQQPPMLDWQHWSQPYSQGDALCRDRSGNLICLTPEVAKKLRW